MRGRRPVTWAGVAWVCRPALMALMSLAVAVSAAAQPPRPSASPVSDYTVGPQDVLTITSYDQADLSGRFSVEADGTFTYPMIGRVKAGGLTLRQVEAQVKKQLQDGGFFTNPQLSVSIEQYKSQKVFIVGEVRSPGMYPLSGDMKLVEALARAGSTLPSASGEAIIVHAATPGGSGPAAPDARTMRRTLSAWICVSCRTACSR